MRLLFFACFVSLMFSIKCSPPPQGLQDAGDIADGVRGGKQITSFCTGETCCSEHRECKQACNRIFHKSEDKVRNQCRSLPKDTVTDLEDLIPILQNPVVDSLELINPQKEFRLLLALDYKVLVKIIQAYTVDEAKELIIWFATNQEPVNELLLFKEPPRNEIAYEMLASVGDRSRCGQQEDTGCAVEEGLAKKISFDESFLQLIISNANYDLLQITHEMIKEDLCSFQYVGTRHIETCILRIYCKEKQDDDYIHSEDLRNEMARNIKDEDFFNHIQKEVLRTGLGITLVDPIMNNDVCGFVCKDGNRGCE